MLVPPASSRRHRHAPTRRRTCTGRSSPETGRESAVFTRTSSPSFSFVSQPNRSSKAPEDRQNHKRDLQRVQLARTSSCRSAQASTTGPLLASAPPRNVGFYCKSS
ncbi:uncharacterized protein LOC109949551 isoform X2 [Prunus persica]|uniref:uncharacterized protein LOC109949551 isoform X2 n=1 Tax=Prunus persica TaxID=3760 RepID=UPI0009AB4AC9|nr:uncharacterized protein LOC109949551 isoform X2 [Prunus persica]